MPTSTFARAVSFAERCSALTATRCAQGRRSLCGTSHHTPLVHVGVLALFALSFAQELFTALLMCPVEHLGASGPVVDEDKPREMCDITVADVLGPLAFIMDRPRDANFSLLTYSFNLVGLGNL